MDEKAEWNVKEFDGNGIEKLKNDDTQGMVIFLICLNSSDMIPNKVKDSYF